ncbi:MAG: cation:proton antiporter [Candidatus Tectimicrobiota bacterium]
MHHLDLLLTLTGGLSAALLLGYLTHRLGLSPLVGYLIGGIAVGPYTPGFVAHRVLAEQLAEIGVILLMFGVGLQFHLTELLAVRRVALPGALVQSAVATGLGALVAHLFGWDWTGGIVLGLALSVASTVVLTRVLTDQQALHTPTGHIAIGWLVVEDLFTVLVLVLLPALFGATSAGHHALPLLVLLALLKLALLMAFTFLVGGRLIPWLLERVAATRSRELFTLTILVLALSIAVGSALLFGVSMALGAFLAGMVVGRSDFSLRAASEALPMRDAFAVLFFVSVGMLLDPSVLLAAPGLVSAILAIILLGKPVAALGILLWLRYPSRVALPVAVALAQIGEFSFILAALGKDLGLLPDTATHTLVAAAILSITVNPLLYRCTERVEAWLVRHPRLWQWLNRQSGAVVPNPLVVENRPRLTPAHRAIVVGYGAVGQTLTRLLQENAITPTVIELNRDTVRRLQEAGIAAVYGDARQPETLRGAGVSEAGSLILSAAGMPGSTEVIRCARELQPAIRILARSAYVCDIPGLLQAGAESVFSGEGEVALALTEALLRTLGATPEQIERERDRVHRELVARGASSL